MLFRFYGSFGIYMVRLACFMVRLAYMVCLGFMVFLGFMVWYVLGLYGKIYVFIGRTRTARKLYVSRNVLIYSQRERERQKLTTIIIVLRLSGDPYFNT